MKKKTIDDVVLAGKRVLVRVDFNVPLDNGRVSDDTRLRASLPTVKKIVADGGRAILMSHLGRPKGQVKPEFSLKPVAAEFARLLGKPVAFAEDCIGAKAKSVVDGLKNGDACLLENLRFHPEEEKNEPGFARELASLGDVYINDAFGSAHRAHASTEGVTRVLPVSAAGYLMQKEIEYLGGLLAHPKRPFVAVLGGAKVSGKLEVIGHLLGKVDTLIIGGGMAFTFIKSQSGQIGRSLVEEDLLDTARQTMTDAAKRGTKFLLPSDCMAAADMKNPGQPATVGAGKIPSDLAGFDIGPDTARAFSEALSGAGTIFWNGPMGVFEVPPFDKGTKIVAEAVGAATAKGAVSVVGGGDSVAAVQKMGLADRISHISTGGGASLEFMEGKVLPGVAALNDA
ncbi:MAG: phosphoglycerate kinase [Candidatus Zixiibacteriota bacterium]